MRSPTREKKIGAIALVLLGSVGCSVQSTARSAASSSWSCPEDRIQITPVADPSSSPPPDIAADPARLALWQKSQASQVEHRDFAASGCGRTGNVICEPSTESSTWTCILGSLGPAAGSTSPP
jgi:hypothetical protein